MALLISLYASRVVLDALGASDYGIFNLVGGFLVFFSFLNASAGNATQRFLSFEAGQGSGRQRRVFGASLRIHLYIALGVFVVAESAGLWFVNTGLAISPEKMTAANVAYQAAVVSAVAGVAEIPYIAAVMASERMGAYSLISIVHMLLKLAIALAVARISGGNSLVAYSCLYAGMSVAVMMLWVGFALSKLHFTRTRARGDKELNKAMLRFLGWDSFARFSGAGRVQGVAVIINRFGGTVLNAGLAIAMQVYAAMIQLGQAVTLAFRPQIIESYASGDIKGFRSLAGNCSRYAFLPVAAVAIPIIIDTDWLLGLWLGTVPPLTASFCRLTLLAALVQMLVLPCTMALEASGNIRLSCIAEGVICLAELPLAWILLRVSGRPELVLAVHPLGLCLLLAIRLELVRRQVPGFGVASFVCTDILLPLCVAAAAWAAASPLMAMPCGFGRFCAITAVSFAVSAAGASLFVFGPRAARTLLIPEKH